MSAPISTRTRTIATYTAVALALFIAVSLVASGQPASKAQRIAVLLFSAPGTEPNLAAFVAGLRDLGYVEGRNVAIEYRYAEGHPERLQSLAIEIVALKPDVIVVLGGDMVPSVKDATSRIPVVMLTSNDPVEAGIVTSFARPGGNITGVAFVASETAAKRLQFLREAAPLLTRVAVLWNPDHPDGEYRDTEVAARRLGIQVQSLEVRRPEDFDGAFQAATHARAEALLVVSSRLMNLSRARVFAFTTEQRIPLVTGWGTWAQTGGLLSYGPDLDTLARRTAIQVDKILKGVKPGDLAVEQPTKFELVINLKTAKALGLTIPKELLLRADEVIQ